MASLQAALINIPVVVYMLALIFSAHVSGISTPPVHMAMQGSFEENVRVLEILVGNLCQKCVL